jgi:hypothetical protein
VGSNPAGITDLASNSLIANSLFLVSVVFGCRFAKKAPSGFPDGALSFPLWRLGVDYFLLLFDLTADFFQFLPYFNLPPQLLDYILSCGLL